MSTKGKRRPQLQYFNVMINGVLHQLFASSRHEAIKQAKRTEEFLKKEKEKRERTKV